MNLRRLIASSSFHYLKINWDVEHALAGEAPCVVGGNSNYIAFKPSGATSEIQHSSEYQVNEI